MDPWGRPFTTGPGDYAWGTNEWGEPVYRTALGHTYSKEPATGDEAPAGILEMLLAGFTAPRRAADGEPVSLGEVYGTALETLPLATKFNRPRTPKPKQADDAIGDPSRRKFMGGLAAAGTVGATGGGKLLGKLLDDVPKPNMGPWPKGQRPANWGRLKGPKTNWGPKSKWAPPSGLLAAILGYDHTQDELEQYLKEVGALQ